MRTIPRSVVNATFALVVALFVLGQFAFKEKAEENKKAEPNVNQWYTPEIPSKMDFAGENVPLDRWDIRERLDRELLINYYGQNNIIFLIKLSNRYFPIIEERLKANGVPDDFKYLCIAESNLMATATSRVGAAGFWQFMSGTAPGYDLEVNESVDFRRDLLRSTDAACQYLKTAYNKFGSWTAAAASYNCGMGGYNGQVTFQKTSNYYDLLLPEETNRYMFRILAFKHIMQNAESLGFKIDDKDLYPPVKTRTVVVTSTVPDLAAFAIQHGTTYKMLRILNPWLKTKSLKVRSGKSYTIHLPA